ncbi:MAG TPA: glycoside hydrolase family 16 protein [Ohtaekwangia sp.]
MKILSLPILCLWFFTCADTKEEKRTLVWSDEFNYTGKPDPSKWSYDLGSQNNGWGNNELQYYTEDEKNVTVKNDMLIIEAVKEEKGYTSARIVSKGKGDWVYGRIDVRAKLPKGKGTWPAIWMLSSNWKYGGWPESGEIDIMEHVGYDPGVVHGTIHTVLYNHMKQTQKEGITKVLDCQDTFHTYSLDWTENKMDFLIDDNVYYTITRDPKEDFNGWPFDQPFYLILNLAVGGNWGGKEGIDESIWPQRMEVDYVRVYQ